MFILLAYLCYFEKMKVGLCDSRAVCVPLLVKFLMADPIFMKLGMYIMAPEPISTV
jgi:hypothetical protein